MTVNRALGVNDLLVLLERLRSTIREFAAKDEATSKALRGQVAAQTKASEAALERLENQLEAKLAEIESSLRNERQRVQTRFDKRKARIALAHQASRKRALEAIDEKEGRLRYR